FPYPGARRPDGRTGRDHGQGARPGARPGAGLLPLGHALDRHLVAGPGAVGRPQPRRTDRAQPQRRIRPFGTAGLMIPYVRDIDIEYGRCDQVSPLIRRVTANNPSPFTFKGTGTYIVGRGDVAVIDPGPEDPAHLQAILAAVEGERVSHIV